MNAQTSFEYLCEKAKSLDVVAVSSLVLDDPRFILWSGSSKPFQHHYGKGGLVIHTAEVVQLCLLNNNMLSSSIENPIINERQLFLAALYHDIGKCWDYEPTNPDYSEWKGTHHKRHIHHISRSSLVWQQAATQTLDPTNRSDFAFIESYRDEILHAILAHHGLREWGSPVLPNTRLAWMLHLCDGISARMNDAEKWDHVNK